MRRRTSTSALPPRSGITLLEVMLALAIFLASLAAISQVATQGMRIVSEAEWESEAVLRAESQMSSVVTGILPMQSAAGAFADDARWQWNLIVATDTLHTDLMRLEMQVSHLNAAGQPTYSFALVRSVRNPDVFLDSGTSASSSVLEGLVP